MNVRGSRSIGNPYASLLNPTNKCTSINEWACSGYRKGFANYPWYVDAKSGDTVVSERDSHRLQIFDVLGEETRFLPHGSLGHGRNQFFRPCGITTTNIHGANVICADAGNRRVTYMRIDTDPNGNGLLNSTTCFGQQMFEEPIAIEHDVLRNNLVVADAGTRRVTLHDMRRGDPVGEMRPPLDRPFQLPADVTIDDQSRVYVTDARQRNISVFDKNGDFIMSFGEGELSKPWGLCFDRSYNLLVSDEGSNRILMYTAGGRLNRVVTDKVYLPKGISVNVHERLVVATGDPYNFLKILQYK